MKQRIGFIKKSITFLRLFFPLVLLVYHVKHNLVALLYWILFFSLISDQIGRGFGLSYLFLSPEYQGETNIWSFAMLGFSFGGLSMAYHSYSYQKLAPRFLFLAMVNKPFVKFCVNNSIIPTLFMAVFFVKMISFQKTEMYANNYEIISYCCGFGAGFLLFIGISLLYFFPVNKNLFEIQGLREGKNNRNLRWLRVTKGRSFKYKSKSKQPMYFYIGRRGKIQKCRSIKHYAPSLLQSVFDQNRISTTVFEITTIVTFVLIGFFGEKSFLDVPAGVSFVLFLTFILMIFSSLLSWLRFWTYPVLVLILFVVNYGSKNWDLFQFETQAYGMDYSHVALYDHDVIERMASDTIAYKSDLNGYIRSLEAWKKSTGEKKPTLVIVNTSGGGSRSAAWVFEVLRKNDSISNGKFSKHVAMVTGASGGMVGAAFYRSLVLEKQLNKKVDLNDSSYFNQISADLLNRMIFAASTNDLFFRYKSSVEFNEEYNYDRAMAFEDNLNENTGNRLKKSLQYYKQYEQRGLVPNLIFSPTIVNDGRRLLISSQPLSFLAGCKNSMPGLDRSYENIDATALFGEKQTGNIYLSSALRMNATFPYVLPMTTLPTVPKLQVMDAGSRDNFGTKVTVDWLRVLEDWIVENTSGVLIVKIRDTKKVLYEDDAKELSFLSKFNAPVGNVFSNFPRTQDFDQDQMLNLLAQNKKYKLKVVSFNLRSDKNDRISLSWHLTEKEKRKVKKAISSDSNKGAFSSVGDFIHIK